MIMHQHLLVPCFRLHPLSSTSEAEMGWLLREPLWLLSPSLFLCGWLPTMLLNPSPAAWAVFCLKLGCGLWGVWQWRLCLPHALLSLTRLHGTEVFKSVSLLMCDSEQHGDPYLAFSYGLAIVIQVKKIHLCQAIDYFHSTVKSCDYLISFLYALYLVTCAKSLFTKNCLLNHLQWVPSSFSTSVKAEKFNKPFSLRY